MFSAIFNEFGIEPNASVKPFGSGLINNTWLIGEKEKEFILQRINQNIFKKDKEKFCVTKRFHINLCNQSVTK